MAKKKTPKQEKARTTKKKAPARKTKTQKQQKLDLYREFVRAHADDYLSDPNITSVGVGYRKAGGETTKELVVQFSVAQKVAPERIESVSEQPIPRVLTFKGEKIPTDVVERTFAPGFIVMQTLDKSERKTRRDPILAGISVANTRATAGTLGALMKDRQTGETVILSNWHVLHTPKGDIGDDVVQPGPYDDNRVAANRVGKLLRSHLGTAGDCAIASIEGRKKEAGILGLKGVHIGRIGKPELDDRVVKSGRTTDVTYGIVTRVDTVTRIPYGDGVTENIGGFEIGPDPDHPATGNEISKGGDSGSAWIALDKNGKPTDIMLGLHFAGDAENSDGEFALACYAHSVCEKLEIEPIGSAAPSAPGALLAEAAQDREDLRLGFDEAFLDFPVPAPGFVQSIGGDLAKHENSRRIDYCHFSLWLSKSRKFARAVAWNVDGGSIRSLSRNGIAFKVDERGTLENYQIDDELYADNPFDRGHIARRADLCWGPMAEAVQANRDSFFFSNITPQHARFNQGQRGGLWGRLEDAIFNDVDVEKLRISLIGGPILRDSDPEYRDLAQVPREFWKLVAYTDAADGKYKVRAFVLTQRDLVQDVVSEVLELDDFRWYQVPLTKIESETGLRFAPAFKALDAMPPGPQGVGVAPARLVLRSADFFA